MKNGYKIIWTDNALEELALTIEYLETHWTQKELTRLAKLLEKTVSLLSKSPLIYPKSSVGFNTHKCVLLKYNTLFYRVENDSVTIVSFFSNRQSPRQLKF